MQWWFRAGVVGRGSVSVQYGLCGGTVGLMSLVVSLGDSQ